MQRWLFVPRRRWPFALRACSASFAVSVAAGLLGVQAVSASTLPPSLDATVAAIFTPPNSATAASLVAEIYAIANATPTPVFSSTPTATVTETPTPTMTLTVTQTPTLRPCAEKTIDLAIVVDNETGSSTPAAVNFSGIRAEGDCTGGIGDVSYSVSALCQTGMSTCATVSGLRPGWWIHSISVTTPASGQLEYTTSLLVAGNAPEQVDYLLFPSVATVQTTKDTGTGSWRSILQAASAQPKPLLIQFDPTVFPPGVPTTITFASAPPNLSTNNVTIDGVDATGAVGNRIISAGGQTDAAMTITGGQNHLTGMRFTNAGGNNRDVLSIDGAVAVSNLVENCIIDTAATADAIGVDTQAGSDFVSTFNTVRNCEVFGAADKGVKVTTGSYARVENSWVHDNANGGIQAALGGHVQAFENLVEDNSGSTAQNGIAVVGSDDNGGTVLGFSELETRGNISRRNGAAGLVARIGGSAQVQDDYLAVNGTSGIRIINDGGPPANAVVQGTSAVCNHADGALVGETSTADFGGGAQSSPGNNAFTQNNLPDGFANFHNEIGGPIAVINSQWEHCGHGTTCDDAAIRRLDLGSGDTSTVISPSQANRNLQPVVNSVAPLRGRRGELFRIYGSGFNVIDGHFSQDDCADVTGRNTCSPLRGNCVQIDKASAPIEAITPTMIVARWPFTCTTPVTLIVKVDQGSTGVSSLPVTVCQ